MTKTPRTDAVAWAEWVPGKTQESTIIALFSFARELELELAAKDAECKAKVIEALEEALEIVESDTHPRRGIRSLIEKRKGEGK